MTAPRFVILHHVLRDSEHWDLMLEDGQSLASWRLSRLPVSHAYLPIPAQRIGDHRLIYLEYEGALSGDRGLVQRIEEGHYRRLANPTSGSPRESSESVGTGSELDWSIELQGRLLSGQFRLCHVRGDDWSLISDE